MATNGTTDFSAFSIEELKEKLRAVNAKTSGNKVDLVKRLTEISEMTARSSMRLPRNTQEDETRSDEGKVVAGLGLRVDDGSDVWPCGESWNITGRNKNWQKGSLR